MLQALCLAKPPSPTMSPTWESPGPAGRPHTAPPDGSASGPAARKSQASRARNTAPAPRVPRPPGPAPAPTAARCAYADGGLGHVGVPPKASPPTPKGAPLPDIPVNVHSVHAQGSGDGTRVLSAGTPEASQHVGRGVVASGLGNPKGVGAAPRPVWPPTPHPDGVAWVGGGGRGEQGQRAEPARERTKAGIPA